MSPPASFFFSVVLACPGLFPFHIHFGNSLLISTKKLAGILIGITLNLYIRFRRIDILTVLSLSVYEHGLYLHLIRPSFISFISVL